jgi:hypothetical protein
LSWLTETSLRVVWSNYCSTLLGQALAKRAILAVSGGSMEKPKVYLNKHDAMVNGLQEPMPIEIICGDCSGRIDAGGNVELLPFRTYLGVDGRCYTCGGGSFVIASELCSVLRRTITERRRYQISEAPIAEVQTGDLDGLWKGSEGEALRSGAVALKKQRDSGRMAEPILRVN